MGLADKAANIWEQMGMAPIFKSEPPTLPPTQAPNVTVSTRQVSDVSDSFTDTTPKTVVVPIDDHAAVVEKAKQVELDRRMEEAARIGRGMAPPVTPQVSILPTMVTPAEALTQRQQNFTAAAEVKAAVEAPTLSSQLKTDPADLLRVIEALEPTPTAGDLIGQLMDQAKKGQ